MSETVLVTGASGGIGAAAAARFARAGHPVALGCYRNPAAAQALRQTIEAAGGAAVVCPADVGDEAAVEAMFAQAEAAFGPVGVLVNAAGIAGQKLFTDITLAEWEAMLRASATGTFLCCRRALPAMIQKKAGCIVNISSIWGQVGASCEVHYSAAKAAVIGLTKALAKEVAPSGVRVNCVAPGVVDTAMMAGFAPEEVDALCRDIPAGRLGTPEEIAEAVYFLASPAAGYLTGQVLGVSGGWGP